MTTKPVCADWASLCDYERFNMTADHVHERSLKISLTQFIGCMIGRKLLYVFSSQVYTSTACKNHNNDQTNTNNYLQSIITKRRSIHVTLTVN